MNVLKNYLPLNIIDLIGKFRSINEIKFKRNASVCVKCEGKNKILGVITDDREFDKILDKLICRSYHSQLANIVEGYISLGEGYRAGVCGRAVLQGGRITNLSDIISVVIRVPRLICGISHPVTDYLQANSFHKGVLLYSPPGMGKTTLLRDIAMSVSSSPHFKRVALIDSRKELYIGEMAKYPLIDPYIGYPKSKGIELAIRTMAPELIICDEIGNEEETCAILSNQNAGVCFIASAHGERFSSLIMRESMNKLYKNGVFGCYMGISRRANSEKLRYEIYEP